MDTFDYTSAAPREGEDYLAFLRRFGVEGWEACFEQRQEWRGNMITWFKKRMAAPIQPV